LLLWRGCLLCLFTEWGMENGECQTGAEKEGAGQQGALGNQPPRAKNSIQFLPVLLRPK
jgi:hypothetical protein